MKYQAKDSFLDVFEPVPTNDRSPVEQQRSLSDMMYQNYQASLASDGVSMFTADDTVTESIEQVMKRLAIPSRTEWKDYPSHSAVLNQKLATQRGEIYRDLKAVIERVQWLDHKMDQAKQNYQAKMDASYRAFHSDLVDQCHQVIQEAKENNTSRFRSMPSNEKVRLNVGGSLFETSYGTLSRDSQSLLAAMFSGRHRLSLEPEGAYFLDRDPLHFRLVLNYLRDLRVPPAILQDTTIREELLQEAHYYRIQGLVDLLSRREDQKSR